MLFHAHSKKLALVALLVIMQSACPAFAQGLGQSGWTTPGQSAGAGGGLGQSAWSMPNESAGASAGLGQSQWATSAQSGAINGGLGQSAWSSGQMSQASGQLGQSSWSAPAQTTGQSSIQPVQNVGQSSWSAPGPKGISAAPQAASQMNTGMSPMDWVNANRAMATKAREQHAQRMNQSQWSPAAGANGFNSATMAPATGTQDPSAGLTGSVSQVDIVGDSTAFQASGDNNAYGRVTAPIAGNGQRSYQGNTDFGEPVGEAVGEPVGELVDSAAPSMQEMMAGMMAVPMMMAASAGLLGQGFGRPFGGGFRSYSGGGMAITPRTMGMGIAGYSVGRMANHLGNQLARQAIRGGR